MFLYSTTTVKNSTVQHHHSLSTNLLTHAATTGAVDDAHAQAVAAGAIVTNLRQEIDELLATGMYDEATDSVIIELKRNLAAAEQRFARMNARAGLA